MTTRIINDGITDWRGEQDDDGNRTYKVSYLIKGDISDGPAEALLTPGLPLPGSTFPFDPWATRRLGTLMIPRVSKEPNKFWDLELNWSTKNNNRCQDQSVQDPLLEPQKVSGGFVKYTEEATKDRFGFPILTSSHEQIRGPQNEWDQNRDSIRIEQNVANLQLALCSGMKDTVSAVDMWGVPAGGVKLSNFQWERKYYGQCNVYYTRIFDFDINTSRDGWTRNILDEGTKCLNGHRDPATGAWILDDVDFNPPDPDNPLHFIRYTDRDNNPVKVILDGHGKPYDTGRFTLTAVSPGATCATATTVSKGVRYGPITSANAWFRVVTDEAIRVIVSVAAGTNLSGVGIDFLKDDCDLAAAAVGDYASGYTRGATKVERTARVPGSAARFSINYTSALSFNFKIFAMDPESSPGQIHVEKYGVSDFRRLGIPLAF